MGSEGEDVFSSSSGRPQGEGDYYRHLIQTKGKLSLTFSAELSPAFRKKVDLLKAVYLKDSKEQLMQLAKSLDQKKQIINESIECLFHMSFDED
jgi:hypothetical protein